MTTSIVYKKYVVEDIDISNWWLDPIFGDVGWRAVYHPLGAADLLDSYTNLVTPGTDDATPGVAPIHDPSRGWIFSSSRYLNTNIVPNSDWTMFIRFDNASVNGGIIAGSNTTGEDRRFYLFPRLTALLHHSYANGDTSAYSETPRLTGGIMTLAGKDGYLNGVYEGSAAAGTWTGQYPVYIGALNGSNVASNFFSGSVQAFALANKKLTAEQIEVAVAYLASLAYVPTIEVDSTRYEFFINEHYIESVTPQITRSIIKPTKYPSNPLTSAVAGASDYGKVYVKALKFGPTDWRMWANSAADTGFDGPIHRRFSYYTSTDGITWAKPNIGLVTYGGNTNNNILIDHPSYNAAVLYDASRPAGTQFLGVFAELPDAIDGIDDQGIFIGKSADGINWSLHKAVVTDAQHGAHLEGSDLVQRPDGRWLVYYATGQGNNTRSIGAYMSDTTSLTGSWTNMGILIPHAGISKQRYSIGVDRYENTYVGFLMQYEGGLGLEQMDLAVSHDGLEWEIVDEAWVPRGLLGQFDSHMIFNGRGLIHHNDDWRYYYAGFAESHHDKQPREAQVGFATLGYGRLAKIEGSPSFSNVLVTAMLQPEAGASLYVNCDASGGGLIRIAVLDEYETELPGFGLLDCDTIDTNTFGQEVFWDGQSLPTNQRIRLQFQIPFNDSILYSYWVE